MRIAAVEVLGVGEQPVGRLPCIEALLDQKARPRRSLCCSDCRFLRGSTMPRNLARIRSVFVVVQETGDPCFQ